ncbi:hypothetical protein F2Q69_00045831 [Brassica cretica]|uniref:Uncharacterized protein n=1 Tax=Brassica cretica TaxID=69181 RepID=A0A8S9NEI2_BRACR|nr:hypothetical protein F2Q69_00045831 [Brassica cretica]
MVLLQRIKRPALLHQLSPLPFRYLRSHNVIVHKRKILTIEMYLLCSSGGCSGIDRGYYQSGDEGRAKPNDGAISIMEKFTSTFSSKALRNGKSNDGAIAEVIKIIGKKESERSRRYTETEEHQETQKASGGGGVTEKKK